MQNRQSLSKAVYNEHGKFLLPQPVFAQNGARMVSSYVTEWNYGVIPMIRSSHHGSYMILSMMYLLQ